MIRDLPGVGVVWIGLRFVANSCSPRISGSRVMPNFSELATQGWCKGLVVTPATAVVMGHAAMGPRGGGSPCDMHACTRSIVVVILHVVVVCYGWL